MLPALQLIHVCRECHHDICKLLNEPGWRVVIQQKVQSTHQGEITQEICHETFTLNSETLRPGLFFDSIRRKKMCCCLGKELDSNSQLGLHCLRHQQKPKHHQTHPKNRRKKNTQQQTCGPHLRRTTWWSRVVRSPCPHVTGWSPKCKEVFLQKLLPWKIWGLASLKGFFPHLLRRVALWNVEHYGIW